MRIREIDINAEVMVMAKEAYPNFRICGPPFYLSGEVVDWRDLAHRSTEEISVDGFNFCLITRP